MGHRDNLVPGDGRWDDFLVLLTERKIPPTRHRFYIYYVERFLSVHRSRPKGTLGGVELARWLDRVVRLRRPPGWQFAPQLEALRVYFWDLLHAPWAAEFDWGHWRSVVHALGDRRDRRRDGMDVDDPVDGSATRSVPGEDAATRLVVEIRRRGYSIRTEQSYLDWVAPQFRSFPRWPRPGVSGSHRYRPLPRAPGGRAQCRRQHPKPSTERAGLLIRAGP